MKKEKRKKRRQKMARLRALEAPPEEDDDVSANEELAERLLEIERQRLHEEWLLREEKAQEEFRIKKKNENKQIFYSSFCFWDIS